MGLGHAEYNLEPESIRREHTKFLKKIVVGLKDRFQTYVTPDCSLDWEKPKTQRENKLLIAYLPVVLTDFGRLQKQRSSIDYENFLGGWSDNKATRATRSIAEETIAFTQCQLLTRLTIKGYNHYLLFLGAVSGKRIFFKTPLRVYRARWMAKSSYAFIR